MLAFFPEGYTRLYSHPDRQSQVNQAHGWDNYIGSDRHGKYAIDDRVLEEHAHQRPGAHHKHECRRDDSEEPGFLVLGGVEQPDADTDERQRSQQLV